eukprot:TRINITY_DN50685_c0_g1_i1.p1 TRINITY_DN50685_c0_g1~~TRINITY_DN50685_c0_g1_i1.p1  ORF type:complete len:506 (+),score=141.57 TRINITY_DN50685_c0_g1_i1:67-1518(+)
MVKRRTMALVAGYAGTALALLKAAKGDVRGAIKTAVAVALVGKFLGGAKEGLLSSLYGIGRKRVVYSGDGVAPGYELVREAFEKHFEQGFEMAAQCAVYVGGKRVVDLCGVREGHPEVAKYTADTLQNVFSSTKVAASIAVAMLADRGRIKYNQKVAEIWPEFAQHGKGEITVAELMRHEAGCPNLDAPIPLDKLTTEAIKAGEASAQLAAQKPSWPKHTRREYHSEDRELFTNEVFRRCDHKGRTIGEFVREEINEPLGTDILIGLRPGEDRRVVDVVPCDPSWIFLHLIIPRFLGSLSKDDDFFAGIFFFLLPAMGIRIPGFKGATTAPDSPNFPRNYNSWPMRRAEVASANGHASARSMARLAAAMAKASTGDALDGVRILTKEGYSAATANPVVLPTFGAVTTNFGNAGFNTYVAGNMQDRGGFVGWQGFGGSVFHWHPELDIGMSYAPNLLEPDTANRRSLPIEEAVLKCVTAQRKAR